MSRELIAVLHCFNNDYVIPAAVSLQSMLECADPDHDYLIHVLHSDIAPEHQSRLQALVARFPGARLCFRHLEDCCSALFEKTWGKGHYAKEMFYKLLAPTLFPEHDKLLVSDVDVVFLGDVSRDYLALDVAHSGYLAGTPGLVRRGSWVEANTRAYAANFRPDEIARMKVAAGYYVANLARMRRDGLEAKFLACADENAWRLRQPEQDVLNLVCAPHVDLLPADSMVCTYSLGFYATEADWHEDLTYPAEAVGHALGHPVQLHYAGSHKPWTHPEVTRSEVWHEVLARTPYLRDHLLALGARLGVERDSRTLVSLPLPFGRGKRRLELCRRKGG